MSADTNTQRELETKITNQLKPIEETIETLTRYRLYLVSTSGLVVSIVSMSVLIEINLGFVDLSKRILLIFLVSLILLSTFYIYIQLFKRSKELQRKYKKIQDFLINTQSPK